MVRRAGCIALLLLAFGCDRGREGSCKHYRADTVELMKELTDAEKTVTEHVTPDARGAGMMRRLAEETENSLNELNELAPKYAPLAQAHRALVTASRSLPRAYIAWADAAENEDAPAISRAEQRVREILKQREAATELIDKICR